MPSAGWRCTNCGTNGMVGHDDRLNSDAMSADRCDTLPIPVTAPGRSALDNNFCISADLL